MNEYTEQIKEHFYVLAEKTQGKLKSSQPGA